MLNEIKQFLNNNKIDYIEQGNNVKSGNINIKCPFDCNDSSQHLGINKHGYYACWLDTKHSGKNIDLLLGRLVGYPVQLELYQFSSVLGADNNIINKINDIITKKIKEGVKVTKILKLPLEFCQINDYGITERFWKYFVDRGFTDKFLLSNLLDKNNIKACLINEYHDRIIFPVYSDNKLVTWNARMLNNRIEPKYKCLASEFSAMKITDCLYNYDELLRDHGRILFVVEGVFDCLKMQYLLPLDCSVTCIFTSKISDNQICLLSELSGNYDEIRILLDNDAVLKSIQMQRELGILKNLKFQILPKYCKDPCELNEKTILELLN